MNDDVFCPLCGSWTGHGRACARVTCLACGSERCFSEGTGRGTCRGCLFGMLPGWSGNNNPASGSTSVRCAYRGCGEMAVYRYMPGSKSTVCKAHGGAILARKKTRAGV